IRRLGCNRWRSRGRDRTPNLDGDSPKPSCLQECRKSALQCRKNTLAWHRPSPVRVHATVTLHPATTSDRMTGPSEVEILLVEDNPSDVELTLRALKTRNLANQVSSTSLGLRSEEHTSELQSRSDLVCRLL